MQSLLFFITFFSPKSYNRMENYKKKMAILILNGLFIEIVKMSKGFFFPMMRNKK